MSWQNDYLNRYYYRRPDYEGGTDTYFAMIRRHVPASATVLELGCGPTNPVSQFLSQSFAAVDGLDISHACKQNEYLREAYVYDGSDWPLPDASYDAIVCNYVLEHVELPLKMIAEVRRVLRPGGVFCFRTPNQYHYVSLVSRCTPHWFHERVANRLRNLDDGADDPYPTFYRMNSRRALRRLFHTGGFAELELFSIEREPSYGMSHKALFLAFLLYERIANCCEEFSFLRSNVLGVFRKPANEV